MAFADEDEHVIKILDWQKVTVPNSCQRSFPE